MHTPVLSRELIEGLAIRDGDTILDATIDGGGHAEAICKRFGKGITIVGIDLDGGILERCSLRLAGYSVRLVKENFRNIDRVLSSVGIKEINRVIFDLGMSSHELDESGRGFTFRYDEPLLMTYDDAPDADTLTARAIVNEWSESSLEEIFRGFADERFARAIARAIVDARKIRPIETTAMLSAVIESAVPRWYRLRRTHFATKTFQALRMAVNVELPSINDGVRKSFEHLAHGGRIGIITFESVTDRAVKRLLKEFIDGARAIPVTKKPLQPTRAECAENPRARSAKLRITERC